MNFENRNQNVNRLLSVMALVSLMFFTVSCGDEDEDGTPVTEADLNIESEATVESAYEDIDAIVDAGMLSANVGGRIMQETDDVIESECVTVTHDAENNTVTVDYGDGCTGPRGRVRAGKIIITYDERRLIPGATRTATFDGFSVDGVQVEGTRALQNISEDITETPTFKITLTGGKLTFTDGTFITREATRYRKWVIADNPLNFETLLWGVAEGEGRFGDTYRVEALEDNPITYKRNCVLDRVFLPVSGSKSVTINTGTDEESTITYDFGEGDCDNEVVITINGVTETKNLDPTVVRRKS